MGGKGGNKSSTRDVLHCCVSPEVRASIGTMEMEAVIQDTPIP